MKNGASLTGYTGCSPIKRMRVLDEPFWVKKKMDWYHSGCLKCPPLELRGTFLVVISYLMYLSAIYHNRSEQGFARNYVYFSHWNIKQCMTFPYRWITDWGKENRWLPVILDFAKTPVARHVFVFAFCQLDASIFQCKHIVSWIDLCFQCLLKYAFIP